MDEFLKQVKGTNAVIVTGITDKFSEFAKSANPDSDGKTIDLETVNKWLKMAFLENTISATDVLDKFEELKSVTYLLDRKASVFFEIANFTY